MDFRRYDILNYQLLSNGSYAYVQIGDWNDGTLTWFGELQKIVTSVCSPECHPGFYKVNKLIILKTKVAVLMRLYLNFKNTFSQVSINFAIYLDMYPI